MANVGDQDPIIWLSVEQVASRIGATPSRVRTALYRMKFKPRGSRSDPFVPETALDSIRRVVFPDEAESSYVGSLSDSAEDHVTLDRLIVGEALSELRRMPAEIAQTAVTSPPFWGQRVYDDEMEVEWGVGDRVAFGREPSPEAYARHSAQMLVEIARVLKPSGTIWWNIGDSYQTRTILHSRSVDRIKRYGGDRSAVWAAEKNKRTSTGHEHLKDKDLALVPFLVAREAQRAGLWLRSVVVWSKQKPANASAAEEDGIAQHETRTHMPEAVTDRPVTGHEYVLMFSKSEKYDYYPAALGDAGRDLTLMNARTVWTFRPVDKGARHGARFPTELPRRCILLSTKHDDLVLDPFAGHATTLTVAAELGRHYLGIEVSPTYAAAAETALGQVTLSAGPGEINPSSGQ